MKLELRDGLLFTSIKVNYLGHEKVISNIEAQIDLKELTVNFKR